MNTPPATARSLTASRPSGPIRIGTRGSPLALAQANEVRRLLIEAHGLSQAQCSIEVFKTTGDRIQDRPLSEVGGKGLFTKELEEALLAHEIDIAVHSMKDMQTVLPEGLMISCILPREDPRDAFISLKYACIEAMPAGAVIGTSSLRRQAQIMQMRPDLTVVPFRGNVETRLSKLAHGVADGTFLACAGLRRLGLQGRVTQAIATDVMLPAVAQGAVAIETRSSDPGMIETLAPLNDTLTATAVAAERAFLKTLDGSCRTPIAGHATLEGGNLTFDGMILAPDGSKSYATRRQGPAREAADLGHDAADELLRRAGPRFLETGHAR